MDKVYTPDTKKQNKTSHWNRSIHMNSTGSAKQPDLGENAVWEFVHRHRAVGSPAKPALKEHRKTGHSHPAEVQGVSSDPALQHPAEPKPALKLFS